MFHVKPLILLLLAIFTIKPSNAQRFGVGAQAGATHIKDPVIALAKNIYRWEKGLNLRYNTKRRLALVLSLSHYNKSDSLFLAFDEDCWPHPQSLHIPDEAYYHRYKIENYTASIAAVTNVIPNKWIENVPIKVELGINIAYRLTDYLIKSTTVYNKGEYHKDYRQKETYHSYLLGLCGVLSYNITQNMYLSGTFNYLNKGYTKSFIPANIDNTHYYSYLLGVGYYIK